MGKRLVLIAILMVSVLTLSGCNLLGYDESLDNAQIVAKVNDTEITKADWLANREYVAQYYQQYYAQYLGINMPVTDEAIESYGEEALQTMIESIVVQNKIKEYGFEPLDEEHVQEVETYADSMVSLYKQLLRMQNYPDIETVEEERDRLSAEATPSEATVSEPAEIDPTQLVATVTDSELDEMLENDLAEIGYTRDYFVTTQTRSVQNDLLREEVIKDIAVTDDEVRAEFDARVSEQQSSYDETPTLYASAVKNGSDVYYTPNGYRGVKNLLVKITEEDQNELDELKDALTSAQNAKSSAQSQLDDLNEEDTSEYDDDAKAAYDEEIVALTQQLEDYDTTIEKTQKELDEKTEAAYATILPRAQEALERLKNGEDFDNLLAEYGEDDGMNSEPVATQGYLVCEGLDLYSPEFQDAAMALMQPGDTSDLVKTSYGYHIIKYEMDIKPGVCEYTDEIADDIRSELLTKAQDAAYEAAVSQWVSEADVKTYPNAMK